MNLEETREVACPFKTTSGTSFDHGNSKTQHAEDWQKLARWQATTGNNVMIASTNHTLARPAHLHAALS